MIDLDSVAQLPRTALSHGALYRSEVPGSSKPTVLLVHGAGHGAWCYGAWMRELAGRGYSSAALDLRGHGSCRFDAQGEPRLTLDDGIRDYADDVIEAARCLPPRSVLAGHSLGGLVVALAAMDLDLAGLALLASSPPGNLPNAKAIDAVAATHLTTVPPRDEVLRRFLGGRDPGAATLDRYRAMLCPESPRAMNDRYRLRVPIDPARVRTSVLVVDADRDDALRHPRGQGAAIARMLGGEHVVLADAAHCLMVGPDAMRSAAVLIDWMARIAPG
jgi:pimeloyl-ACP methyl ester carboxylesterase